ncbi:MAG: glycosyltransferase family 2 protein [Chitinophagaceae bacterium]|jgi:dolichol-phosphate mannosyltransferase|nr:glycosyltransferase family 2 protein [Chitinophagaceae bacterium]MBK7679026.1 glycosyltransferase family 2 protein [Chitinophagaceae bacterium]MBK8299629.1 glycosyltransferase family 2 protein [Chitinophagaceae bacterium]MBK9463680.1 glycosyltransferase family 2 protein [Chitinophagaceae bacterium]MBK9659200.1 glycosyltransferase family 2 protein [Chitinophagaceae bacterium]
MMISIVIPVLNEEELIDELYNQTSAALNAITTDWEVICVNDGSNDNTLNKLVSIHEKDRRWKIISLSKNFGHQPAIWAGLNYAQGDHIGIMDGDLQDDPANFQKFIAQLSPTVDILYAVRTKRKENFFKRTAYRGFYRLLKNVFGVKVPLDSGDFCLMKKKVVDEMLSMPEHSLFIRGIRSWVGFNQVGVDCERNERFSGQPKYSTRKLMKLAYDGMFSFSDFPIKFLGKLGLIIIMASIAYAGYIITKRFVWGQVPAGFTTLIIVILFFGGVQLVTVRILGEYLLRIYNESRKRPLYIISNKYGQLKNAGQ